MLKKTGTLLILLLLYQSILAQSSPSSPKKPQTKSSQHPTPSSTEDDVIRIDLNLIQVDAVVTDKNGRQVTNLRAEDFSLIENGQVHTADYCVYVPLPNDDTNASADAANGPPSAAELRRTFVFIVDNPRIEWVSESATISRSPSASFYLLQRVMRGAIEAEKLLSWFVNNEVGPTDLVAIADTEVNVGVLSSFTNDRATLREAIRQVRVNPTSGRAPIIKIMSINEDLSLTELAKQNLRVLETVSNSIKQLQTLPGRKIVTLLSRGMLFNPQWPGADRVIERMEKLIEEANRARVSIYAMSPAGVGNFGGDSLQNFDSLIHLARETGGRAIYNTNDTRVGFAEIVEKSRGYYLLAYKGDENSRLRPHVVKVRLNRPDLRVEARSFAYSRGQLVSNSDEPGEVLRRAINSPLRQTAIPLEVTHSFVSPDRKKGQIVLALKVGVTEADLVTTNETAEAEFDLAVRITGPDGALTPPTIHILGLTASTQERSRALREGITTRIQIPADAPGFYRMSVAVRSKQTGDIGSTNLLVEATDLVRKRKR